MATASPTPDAWIVRRDLFTGSLFGITHIACRPTPDQRHPVEHAAVNVVALPTSGVFALHPAPRQQVVATPSHAVFLSSGRPYRLTFPGGIGDECITLRLTSEGLDRLAPEAMSGDGFDEATPFARAVLSPAAILARSLLERRLARGEVDALEIEELGLGLLKSTLGAVRPLDRARPGSCYVERVKEAISTEPERKWTLAELAGLAGVSPFHLAHAFHRQVGTSVHRYATRSRLAQALGAVLDSNLDLTSIALDAGFASHSHFTARFRAFFGLTPDALRKTARGGQAAALRKIVTARMAAAA